jgi:hypothetical protein
VRGGRGTAPPAGTVRGVLTASAARRALALVAALAVGAAPASAVAATKHGITPLAPRAGGSVAAGKAASFRMRVKGKGKVFVHVCKSSHKAARDGTICSKVTIGQAVKRNGVFTYTQKFYDYPAFWLNRPGTYYWQAYRIECVTGNTSDCRQEGPVVKFRVR